MFGERIRALRRQRGLDQTTLAARVDARLWAQGRRGFDKSYLSKIETGRSRPPSQRVIIALAEELDADVDTLVTLAGKTLPGLGLLLQRSAGARQFSRAAASARLSEEDWQYLADLARRRAGGT